jgi:hypothetical protein
LANRKKAANIEQMISLPSMKTFIVNIIIGLILGFLGPFGSYSVAIVTRLIFWVLAINLGYFIYYFSRSLVNKFFADKNLHLLVRIIIASLFASVPLTLLIVVLNHLLFTNKINLLNGFTNFFPQVFILGIVIDAIITLINNSQIHHPTQKLQAETNTFLDRLNPTMGMELICFVMEDHYLKAYTAKGNQMLLMRMKDALLELKDYQGMQVHRSWWVAFAAIDRVKKQGRKIILVMNNGIEVPVSRKYQASVRGKGF